MDKRLKKCVHFNGVQNKACDAGVAYSDVECRPAGGPITLPCAPFFAEHEGAPCARRELYTQARLDAEDRESELAFKAVADGRCPCHGEPGIRAGNYLLCATTNRMVAHYHPRASRGGECRSSK